MFKYWVSFFILIIPARVLAEKPTYKSNLDNIEIEKLKSFTCESLSQNFDSYSVYSSIVEYIYEKNQLQNIVLEPALANIFNRNYLYDYSLEQSYNEIIKSKANSDAATITSYAVEVTCPNFLIESYNFTYLHYEYLKTKADHNTFLKIQQNQHELIQGKQQLEYELSQMTNENRNNHINEMSRQFKKYYLND